MHERALPNRARRVKVLTMSELDQSYVSHKRRDPKPTASYSWWLDCKTHEELGKEARLRFPSAVVNDGCIGVVYQNAAEKGVL